MSTETTKAAATEAGSITEEQTSAAPAPNSVAGQRHVSPANRHSQQARGRAVARAEALGLTTERELYDHDRAAALAKLKKGTDDVLAQKKNEQDRKTGAGTEKA
jgi:hypothetical protein